MERKIYSPEEIKKKFESLPQDIQAAVYSADMLRLIQTIGQKYKLHLDQLDVLEAETADVMTGFSDPKDFVSNLSESLPVGREQAELIAKDINDGLFIKIRESMKKTYEAGKVSAPAPSPAPAPAAKPAPPPAPPAPAAPKPPEMHPADALLTQKTVSVAPPTAPPKPKPYTTDPYREPTQ